MKKRVNVKDVGIRLALAGLGTALSVAFIALSYYLSFMTLSFTVLTSVGIMIPLSKDYYREGILCAISAGVIGFFIANVKIVPYAMASGLYVVLTVFLHNKKINKIITTVAKLAYSCLVFWIIYKVTDTLVINFEKLTFLQNFNEIGLYVILNLIFSLCFLAYDILLCKGYEYAKQLAKKVLKSRGNTQNSINNTKIINSADESNNAYEDKNVENFEKNSQGVLREKSDDLFNFDTSDFEDNKVNSQIENKEQNIDKE